MKKNIFIISCWLLTPFFIIAQTTDYKVVFDVTSKDTMDHKAVIRWLNEISNAHADAKMEVVFYALSLGMVTTDRSVVAGDIARLQATKNVSFKVCAIAMKNQKVDQSQLLPGVEIVPDGIYEIISKQKNGWGYIKVKL
jgi:intracellular sulfur oxidation DsrE/DsrF family protein